jgi:RNA polymerase sigma-70 factor (ECF subfamily)
MSDNKELKGPSDADLIEQAQAGQVDSFGELYQRHVKAIFLFINSRVGSKRDAEDLTETVFLQAFEALDRYEERGAPFSAYLYRIARNLVIDHYRGQEPLEPLEDLDWRHGEDPVAERQVIDQQQVERIKVALAKLPEHYQEVIRLRLLVGMPTKTVAEWMDREPSTVRVIQHRALKALRDQLGVGNE